MKLVKYVVFINNLLAHLSFSTLAKALLAITVICFALLTFNFSPIHFFTHASNSNALYKLGVGEA